MIEILIVGLIALTFSSVWAAIRFTRWHRFYGTRFLWGMRLVSYAVVAASTPIAILAARRLLGFDSMPEAAMIVAAALLILIGVVTWLAWRWGDLDNGMQPEEAAPPNETRNQREDRYMGDQRREIEENHKGNDMPNDDLDRDQ